MTVLLLASERCVATDVSLILPAHELKVCAGFSYVYSAHFTEMPGASDRKSQIRLLKAKLIHRFEMNACCAAKIDQIGNNLLVLKVFTNV